MNPILFHPSTGSAQVVLLFLNPPTPCFSVRGVGVIAGGATLFAASALIGTGSVLPMLGLNLKYDNTKSLPGPRLLAGSSIEAHNQ